MDWVRLHVAINEVPAIGIGVGTAMLLISVLAGGRTLQKAAFRLFALSAVFGVFAFWTGAPAQSALRETPGMSETLVDAHWYAARLALSVSVLLGLVGI